MRDLQNLRQRIAQADQHFKAAEEARTRESDTLAETWESLKQRFDTQQLELARYRARLEVLVDANDELAVMIDRLIGTIEASAKRAQDETVPRMTRLARDLLVAEPSPAEMERLKAGSIETGAAAEEDIPSAEGSVPAPAPGQAAARQPIAPDRRVIAADNRNGDVGAMIERIEGRVVRGTAPNDRTTRGGQEAGPPNDDSLARELRDIEILRNELTGLRDRITSDAGH